MDEFNKRCAKIAERFLLTAVIVDDEAQISDLPKPTESLETPTRHTVGTLPEGGNVEQKANTHSLDARTIVESFAKRGLICAVTAPWDNERLVATVLPAARRADIVILDWQLHDDDGARTLKLLESLLQNSEVGRLRLIAIYTGEDDLIGIQASIKREMSNHGWNFKPSGQSIDLTFGHCRIVIYAKAGTQLGSELRDRAISEDDVPNRLIKDFTLMTSGLLPSITLISLAAVRESAHKVLSSFSSELDAAFLAHRACLPIPDDSQQHIVNLLDSELHAIMDDASTKEDPANIDAIREWLLSRFGHEKIFEFGRGRKLSLEEIVALLQCGLDNNDTLGRKDFTLLSSRFRGNGEASEELDQRLAWMFNFRTVTDSPSPILQLGTVLQLHDSESGFDFFVCMRPRCDSLRLQNAETFLFLPLIDPVKDTIQLVLKTDKCEYSRRSLCTSPSQWLLVEFAPDDSKKCVVAKQDENGQFSFSSTNGTRFNWIGELKAEFAQRVAQHLASGLSRVATDNSEWLRRHEGSSR